MNTRRLRLGVLALAAAALLSVAAPARAADPDPTIAVSSDGVVWGTDLSEPLFDPTERWVPGDTGIASFYLRNDAASSASVRIEARDLGTQVLTANGDVVLHARVAGGNWVLLPMEETSALLNPVAVPVGGVTRIDVQAVFAPTAGNGSKDQVATLEFVVRLRDANADAITPTTPTPTTPGPTTTPTTPTDETLPDSNSNGALPGMGAPAVALPVLGGFLLIGTGLALTRRRDREAVDG
jgi:hypothetical protein